MLTSWFPKLIPYPPRTSSSPSVKWLTVTTHLFQGAGRYSTRTEAVSHTPSMSTSFQRDPRTRMGALAGGAGCAAGGVCGRTEAQTLYSELVRSAWQRRPGTDPEGVDGAPATEARGGTTDCPPVDGLSGDQGQRSSRLCLASEAGSRQGGTTLQGREWGNASLGGRGACSCARRAAVDQEPRRGLGRTGGLG